MPRALPCRKIPLAVQDEVKKEVDSLVKRSVLVPVETPTKWVSQMAVVRKINCNPGEGTPQGPLRIHPLVPQ